MQSTITTAAREYAERPRDERLPNLAALVEVADTDKRLSGERAYHVRDLRAVSEDGVIRLQSPNGTADLSHWSFGQLSRMVGAPAAYIRDLPAELGARCLTHGLHDPANSADAVMLVRAPNGRPRPLVRGFLGALPPEE